HRANPLCFRLFPGKTPQKEKPWGMTPGQNQLLESCSIHHTPLHALHSLEMPRLYHRWTVSGLTLEYSAARSCVMSRRTHKVIASSSFQVRFAFFMASSTRSDDGQRRNLTALYSSMGVTSP